MNYRYHYHLDHDKKESYALKHLIVKQSQGNDTQHILKR